MVQDGFLLQGPASWLGKYYKYRVKVYSPWSQRIETLEATDPYSRSLAADGARTQVCPDGTFLLRASPVDWGCSCTCASCWDPASCLKFLIGNQHGSCELQIINLSAPDLAPEGWAEEASPTQGPFTDISVYELHIRDFSASDGTVPERLRGKYLAFGLVGRFYRSTYILCWSQAHVLQPLPHHQPIL